MGEVRGFVTRTLGRTNQGLFGVTSGNAPLNRNQVEASKADGTQIGAFASIREAQSAVERSGGGGLLSWFREDLPSSIEHWRGESRDFYPGALGAVLEGGLWLRGDQGLTRQVPAALPPSTTKLLAKWASFDGERNDAIATTTLLRPTVADAIEIPTTTGRPGILFDAGNAMTTSIALMSPPYSAYAAVSYTDQSRIQMIASIGALANFSLIVDATSEIQVRSDGKIQSVTTIADGTTFILGAIQHATTTVVTLNGVTIGTLDPATPAEGAPLISNSADAWAGVIFEYLLVPTDVNPNIDAKILRYLLDRYNPI